MNIKISCWVESNIYYENSKGNSFCSCFIYLVEYTSFYIKIIDQLNFERLTQFRTNMHIDRKLQKMFSNHPDLFELMYCYDLPLKINIHVKKKLQNDIVKFQNKDERASFETLFKNISS